METLATKSTTWNNIARTNDQSRSTNNASEKTKEQKQRWRSFVGLFFCFAAGIVHAITSILAKKLRYIPSPQLSIHTMAGIMFYSLPIMLYNRASPIHKFKVSLLIGARSFLMGGGYGLAFLALNYIPVADYSVIAGSTPLFTTILAKIFLNEPCGIVHVICLLLNAAGIILVTKVHELSTTREMQYDMSYLWGVVISLAGSFAFGLSNVIVRMPEVMGVHFSVMAFYIGAVTTSANTIISISITGFKFPKCGIDKWLMLIHTIAGNSVVTVVTVALQYEEASVTTLILNTVSIALSFLWQILWDGDIPDMYSSFGAVAMILCIVLICSRAWIAARVAEKCPLQFCKQNNCL